jgi:transcription elongation factor Elf1
MKYFKSKSGSHVNKRKARIYHECSDCGCSIQVNEEYYVITYIDEYEEFHTIKVCENCWKGSQMDANNPRTYNKPW